MSRETARDPDVAAEGVDSMSEPESRRGDYRAFMRATASGLVVPTVERQFLAWLDHKGVPLSEGPLGTRREDSGSWAAMQRLETEFGMIVRCRLTEETAKAGRWGSEILASSAGWIHIEIHNSHGRYAAVPGLAKSLMRELELRDASLELRDQVRMWDEAELDSLVELLMAPDRNGLVLVAGTGPDPALFDGFNSRLPRWIGDAYGLAQVISLTPQATYGLSRRLEEHAPHPWTIRTYYPGLRLGSGVDARRHRYLSVDTLARQPDSRIRQLLGSVARRHAAARDVPREVVDARRSFERAGARELIDRLATAVALAPAPNRGYSDTPTPMSKPGTVVKRRDETAGGDDAAALGVLHRVLGIDTVTEESVRAALRRHDAAVRTELHGELEAAAELLDEQLERLGVLEDENRALTSAADDDELEHAELDYELERLRGEVKWLRGKFAEVKDFDTAFAAAPEGFVEEFQDTCEALVSGLQEGDVIFTGDLGSVRRVDESDSFGCCVREASRCIFALREYVRAKADGMAPNGVDHFLRHRPTGYDGVSPGKHARGETSDTMTHYGHERMFPVPVDVVPEGRIQMVAHFKLARLGRISPRMYYFDDTPRSGCVYVGYLGPHLTNSMSD
jgi:hypothetical protein